MAMGNSEKERGTGWRAMSAGEIAQLVEGKLDGDAGRSVSSIETLERAGPEALSWLGDAKYTAQLAASRAGVVLVPIDCVAPASIVAVRVRDPDLALCRVLERMAPQPPQVEAGVHPSALVAATAVVDGAAIGPNVVIGAGARIGSGTQLHAGVYVGTDSVIGRGCVLWPNVVVRERCTIGDRVVIHASTTIGADGFGYLFRDGAHRKVPQVGTVQIDDDVEIGANCCVDRAKSGVTRIRSGVKIDNLVQIGHNCDIGEHCVLVAQVGVSGSVTIGRYCVLAGQAGVADHLTLGSGVRVGAQAGVAQDVADREQLLGSPARDSRAYLKQDFALRRLPELLAQFRELKRRVEALESSDDDRKGA